MPATAPPAPAQQSLDLVEVPPDFESNAVAYKAYVDMVHELFSRIFRPDERLHMSEWAERYRHLAGGAEPGPWRNSRTPYLVEIMDAISDPTVREVVLMKSARVGYTEGIVGNAIGYYMHHRPRPMLVVQPTQQDAKDWSKKTLDPLIQETPVLNELGVWADPVHGRRNKSETILDKFFNGGAIIVRGAKSPKQLRRHTAPVVLQDEIDAFDVIVGEGDPTLLADRAARTYPDRKYVKGSTPTTLDESRIHRLYQRSDRRRFHVPCPRCGHAQVLKWGGPDEVGGLKWDRDVHCGGCGVEVDGDGDECRDCGHEEVVVKDHTDTTYYQCESCEGAIHEWEKAPMVQSGEWIPENPGAYIRGYHISSLYTLLGTWADIVEARLKADDEEALQVWVNQFLGEPWERRNREVDLDALEDRAHSYGQNEQGRIQVPHGVGILTAGVDVQGDRLEVAVVGWGAGQQSWLIDHQRVYGDPEAPDIWHELDEILFGTFLHASGRRVRIRATMVDSRYLAVPVVYPYVRSRELRGVYAWIGVEKARQVLVRATRKNHQKVKPWTVSTWHYKRRLFRRLKVTRPGAPGYMDFCLPTGTGADAEFFAQFAGEVPVQKLIGGQRVIRYKQVRRNEAIDLYGGATAALDTLGDVVTRRLGRLAKVWSTPPTDDEDEEEQPPEEATGTDGPEPPTRPLPPPRSRRRRGGDWAGGWR